MKNSAEQLPKHDYKLCILVPAYNYFEGVERILDLVKSDDRVSVVISDDSDDYDCATKIKNMVQTVNLERVVYMHGPGKGAGQNWNSLFKYINAEYYTFLHHDEVYSDLSFVDVIETSIDLECLILPCLVIHANGVRKISSRHQKGTMFVAKRFVPVFNFLGPTSTLIVKSDIKPKFNLDLNWYIDIEWFHRVFNKCSKKIIFSHASSAVESYQYESSITNTSIGSIRVVQKKEQAILFNNGYKWTIIRWYVYGYVVSKSIFYAIGFSAYVLFYSSLILYRLKKWFPFRV